MTVTPAAGLRAGGMDRARATARRLAEALIAGSALKIREGVYELVIVNPDDPDKGEVHIDCASGKVWHTRKVEEEWGILTGYENTSHRNSAWVGSEKILTALAPAAPSAP